MLTTPNLHDPKEFDEAYGDRQATFYAGLLAYVVRVGKPGPILDLGTGLGFLPELAMHWGIPSIGVEGAQYAVDKARSRVPGINVICCDLGESVPIGDGTVANVVLHQVIEHLDQERLDRVWRECLRVMMEGGTLFVYSPSRRNIRERGERTHINMLLPSELRRQLTDVGFSIVQEPNEGFWWMGGGNSIAGRVAAVALQFLPHDWISATTNAIAVKRRTDVGH